MCKTKKQNRHNKSYFWEALYIPDDILGTGPFRYLNQKQITKGLVLLHKCLFCIHFGTPRRCQLCKFHQNSSQRGFQIRPTQVGRSKYNSIHTSLQIYYTPSLHDFAYLASTNICLYVSLLITNSIVLGIVQDVCIVNKSSEQLLFPFKYLPTGKILLERTFSLTH